MCYSFEFSQYCTGIASILSLFMITCERYYVICKPLAFKSVITKSRTVKLIILIWIISVLINLPLIFFTNYDQIPTTNSTNMENTCQTSNDNTEISSNNITNRQEYKCEMFFDEHFNNWHIYYILTIAFFVYFFLGIVLIFMYYKISQHLKESQEMLNKSTNINNKKLIYKSNNNANSDNAETNLIMSSENDYENNSTIKLNSKLKSNNHKTDTLQSGSGAASSNDFDRFIKPRKQLIFMLQCIIIVFYVCVYPFKMLSLINVFYSLPLIFSERTLSYVVMAARILFYMNSSINPILYNMLSKKFRHSFKRLLIFRICFGKQDDSNYNNQSSNFNVTSTTK
jgi:hypothetical protein